MGRPSKLSDADWIRICERVEAGEKAADLAREYGVSKTAVSLRISKRSETVRNVAHELVASEIALRKLPISEQVSALNLADELRAVSTHLASAAKFGAATAHRLSGIAHAQVQKIDDAEPLGGASLETLRGVSALTKLANDSSSIGLNLLAANKEMAKPETSYSKRLQKARERVKLAQKEEV